MGSAGMDIAAIQNEKMIVSGLKLHPGCHMTANDKQISCSGLSRASNVAGSGAKYGRNSTCFLLRSPDIHCGDHSTCAPRSGSTADLIGMKP
jgi:hypothetical protein